MATRKTKAQRKEEQRSILERRVLDIAAGAAGCAPGCEEDDYEIENITCDPKALCRFIGGIEAVFGDQLSRDAAGCSLLSRRWNIDEYENLKSTVDFLWGAGVRANKKGKQNGNSSDKE